MPALTVLLLAVGALLAALGTAGFCAVAQTAPDPHDLTYTRAMASIGRRAIYAGVIMLAAGHASLTGPAAGIVAVVGFLAAASYLTRAPINRAQAGAA